MWVVKENSNENRFSLLADAMSYVYSHNINCAKIFIEGDSDADSFYNGNGIELVNPGNGRANGTDPPTGEGAAK